MLIEERVFRESNRETSGLTGCSDKPTTPIKRVREVETPMLFEKDGPSLMANQAKVDVLTKSLVNAVSTTFLDRRVGDMSGRGRSESAERPCNTDQSTMLIKVEGKNPRRVQGRANEAS